MSKKIIAHLRRWHRRLGISAALFILLLSISGLILNHSDQMSLPHSFVEVKFIQSIYGLKDPKQFSAFAIKNTPLVSVDGQLWLQNKLILEDAGELVSAVYFNGVIVAAVKNGLLLLSEKGDIIEKMDSSSAVPENISQLAIYTNGILSADKIWINTPQGLYVSDEQLINWQLAETATIPDWVSPVALSDAQISQFSEQYRSRMITWERVLLDFHSGRMFGLMGPLFSDLVALLLILLSISGIAMWLRKSRSKKANKI